MPLHLQLYRPVLEHGVDTADLINHLCDQQIDHQTCQGERVDARDAVLPL
jgi:hypothetical protein